MHHPGARHGRVIALAIFCCALVLAACGSSSKKPAAKSFADSAIAYSQCMREHGVTNFPDPGGGAINIAGTGINPASPAFQAARTTCRKLLPFGGSRTHASEQEIKQDVEMAECMRKHGVTGFPDPIVTATSPAIGTGEYSQAEYGNGIVIGIPSSINVNSPAFEAAAKACGGDPKSPLAASRRTGPQAPAASAADRSQLISQEHEERDGRR